MVSRTNNNILFKVQWQRTAYRFPTDQTTAFYSVDSGWWKIVHLFSYKYLQMYIYTDLEYLVQVPGGSNKDTP